MTWPVIEQKAFRPQIKIILYYSKRWEDMIKCVFLMEITPTWSPPSRGRDFVSLPWREGLREGDKMAITAILGTLGILVHFRQFLHGFTD